MKPTQYRIQYLIYLTLHVDDCVWVHGGVGIGPQHTCCTREGSTLPSGTQASSGKSAIFTSNGIASVSAGFDFPAEFAAVLKPGDPLKRLQQMLSMELSK